AAHATGIIDTGALYLILSITVLAAAWFAGTVNALVVTVAGALIGALTEHNPTTSVQVHLAVFVVQGVLLTTITAELRRSWLAAALTEALSQLASGAAAKDVRLHIGTGEGPVVVRGDANRLRQVLWHLLGNAIKFTPRGGTIDVRLDTNDLACVTVRDSGPGI